QAEKPSLTGKSAQADFDTSVPKKAGEKKQPHGSARKTKHKKHGLYKSGNILYGYAFTDNGMDGLADVAHCLICVATHSGTAMPVAFFRLCGEALIGGIGRPAAGVGNNHAVCRAFATAPMRPFIFAGR